MVYEADALCIHNLNNMNEMILNLKKLTICHHFQCITKIVYNICAYHIDTIEWFECVRGLCLVSDWRVLGGGVPGGEVLKGLMS